MSGANEEVAKRAVRLVDLTNLNDECVEGDIVKLAEEAVTPHGNVAALCVWGEFVKLAKEVAKVKVATVVNFPHGGDDISVVVGEVTKALEDGADEIDLVQPYKSLIGGNQNVVREMVGAVKKEVGSKCVKVILETGELSGELIEESAVIALNEGADFIKTSTGKVEVNATTEAVQIMLKVIKKIGAGGLKISGGVREVSDVIPYFNLIDEIVGEEWVSPETVRIGASSLLGNLIEELK